MSWLLNSMQPEIAKTCLFLHIAREIWDAVSNTHSTVGMKAQIYGLKVKIHNTKQGASSVAEYYNKIESLWLELDHYQNFEIECSSDVVKLQKTTEREWIFDFLAGLKLNPELDQVRSRILGKEYYPLLMKFFLS